MKENISTVDSHPQFNYKKDVFLLLLLAISLSINVLLGWKVKSLNGKNKDAPAIIALPVGASVSPILVTDRDNEQEVIDFNGVKDATVLYVLSPKCFWCDQNLKNINALAEFGGQSYRFLGVSLIDDGLEDYLIKHRYNFPVYKKPSRESVNALGLGSQQFPVKSRKIILLYSRIEPFLFRNTSPLKYKLLS